MERAIFLSYRREDSEGESGRLFDDLVHAFGESSVFMDVAGIQPGIDFRQAVKQNVGTCGVLLAVIGPRWATVTDRTGQRRLENANDFVRLEVAAALERNIPLIPVLVHDAQMPHPDQLPDDLKDLAYRNSVEITHARWKSDVELLTRALRQYVSAPDQTSSQPVHATKPVHLRAPNGATGYGFHKRPAVSLPTLGVASLAALLAVGGTVFVLRRHGSTPVSSAATQPPATPAAIPAISPPAASPAKLPAVLAASPGRPVLDPPHSKTPVVTAHPVPEKPKASAPIETNASSEQTPPESVITYSEGSLLGNWADKNPKGTTFLQRISITRSGSGLMIHAWAECGACDWKEAHTQFEDGRLTALFDIPDESGQRTGRQARVTISPLGRQLLVEVKTGKTNHPPRYFDRQP